MSFNGQDPDTTTLQRPSQLPENVEVVGQFQRTLDQWGAGRKGLRVLEAGCGSTSHLRLPEETHLVGIDVSEEQLAAHTGLSERILDDLETHEFDPQSFDLVICWDVLEHLAHPERAVQRMAAALKPGGLLIVAIPNAASIKGLVTKATPHQVHVLFYRFLHGNRERDRHQFRTFLRWRIRPSNISNELESCGLMVTTLRPYVGPVQQVLIERHGWVGKIFDVAGSISKALSRGRLDVRHSDLLIAAQRP